MRSWLVLLLLLNLRSRFALMRRCDGAGFQIALRGHRVAQFIKDVQLLHMTD
jgi:hypothetical protein